MRTFESETRELIKGKVKTLLEGVEKKGLKVEYSINSACENVNSKKEAEAVIRVAKCLLGEDKVSSGTLPTRAS